MKRRRVAESEVATVMMRVRLKSEPWLCSLLQEAGCVDLAESVGQASINWAKLDSKVRHSVRAHGLVKAHLQF